MTFMVTLESTYLGHIYSTYLCSEKATFFEWIMELDIFRRRRRLPVDFSCAMNPDAVVRTDRELIPVFRQ